MAAHGLDVAAYHVHAHTAPGHVADLLGGGEAGSEDQLPDLVVRHVVGHSQALTACLGQQFVAVETGTVVADLDQDVAALMLGGQGQPAGARLAGSLALLGRFDAVIEAIAYQVGQRIDDPLDQTLVQLSGLALGDQLDILAQLGGQVAHLTREAAEHVVHLHHADRHHRFLQVARIALEQAHAVDQLAVYGAVQLTGSLLEHRLGNDQLADQVDDLVDLVHRHAQAAGFGTGRCSRLGRARVA
ncbi:hypothetical protein D9M71_311270 [compost metagenome]